MSNKLGNDVIVQPEVVVPRRLGLSSGIAFVVGTIIGALVMAELGLLLPRSGGSYVYLHKAFGNFPAFLFV